MCASALSQIFKLPVLISVCLTATVVGAERLSMNTPTPPPANMSAAGAPEKDFTITDNVNLVLLDVSVKDPKGGYVTGLQKGNFQVNENGRAQTISEFSSVDTPVSVGLVVDNSGSMRNKRPEVVLAGLAFAKESNPQDEFFVINFNNYVVRGLGDILPFTDNLQRLRSALYFGTPFGQTALYDALAYSLKHLELSRREKRTLIVVSDGGDNLSKTTLPQVMDMILASRATIYTVGLFDPEETDRNPDVLKKLAKSSGGEFFQPATLDEVLPVFHKIATEIRKRYTIGFVPAGVNNDPRHPVRAIRVTAENENHKRLNVRTRTSYSTLPLDRLLAQKNSHESRTN